MAADITVVNLITAVLNGISTVALLGATILGAENYRETRAISNFWMYFTFTAATGVLLLGLLTVEQFGIFAATVDALDVPIGFAFIIMLIITAVSTVKSEIAPVIR